MTAAAEDSCAPDMPVPRQGYAYDCVTMARPFTSSDIFRALADPSRRRVMEILLHKEARVAELATQFRISQAALSFHLRALRAAGLVTLRQRGAANLYRTKRSALKPLEAWLASLRTR
jgi:DNA-binding transcriptional ArsR family regulator